jgi:hypothetical protein
VGVVGVKKKKYYVHKRKQNMADFEGSISRIEKVLSEELVHNVGATKCCTMNCCQHFPHGKTLLVETRVLESILQRS